MLSTTLSCSMAGHISVTHSNNHIHGYGSGLRHFQPALQGSEEEPWQIWGRDAWSLDAKGTNRVDVICNIGAKPQPTCTGNTTKGDWKLATRTKHCWNWGLWAYHGKRWQIAKSMLTNFEGKSGSLRMGNFFILVYMGVQLKWTCLDISNVLL